ncbi:hypothetical protein ALQ89_03206 [Pseudomonas amygdali pv. tabaci]|uniref:Transposase n=1 Tax=Pseudomonas amygdali pv. tabaci TaxID=322 RepID=A0AAX1VSL5_PSEAJ|nr:hypothetical protein ALQ89_03206 [Pseudomonas amygdali pv. tabaci]
MTKQRRTFSTEFNARLQGFVLDQVYNYIKASHSLWRQVYVM